MKIGVVGYSAAKFDEDKARVLVEAGIDSLAKLSTSKVEIVSGYTDMGIPALAYRHAAKRGFRTVGIACAKAEGYKTYPVDESYIIGKDWGDESATFIRSIDAFLRVGGGNQSLLEAKMFKQQKPNAPIIELELPEIKK